MAKMLWKNTIARHTPQILAAYPAKNGYEVGHSIEVQEEKSLKEHLREKNGITEKSKNRRTIRIPKPIE